MGRYNPGYDQSVVIMFARVASAALVAACGSSGPSVGAASGGVSPSHAAAGLKFSNCMRAHGVPNFPDPTQWRRHQHLGWFRDQSAVAIVQGGPAGVFQAAARRRSRRAAPDRASGGADAEGLGVHATTRCHRLSRSDADAATKPQPVPIQHHRGSWRSRARCPEHDQPGIAGVQASRRRLRVQLRLAPQRSSCSRSDRRLDARVGLCERCIVDRMTQDISRVCSRSAQSGIRSHDGTDNSRRRPLERWLRQVFHDRVDESRPGDAISSFKQVRSGTHRTKRPTRQLLTRRTPGPQRSRRIQPARTGRWSRRQVTLKREAAQNHPLNVCSRGYVRRPRGAWVGGRDTATGCWRRC